MDSADLIAAVKFDEKGLVTSIAQDAGTGDVLMVAYMDRESLLRTIETGVMTYWSRSKGRFHVKGETSGHLQHVREIRLDCDGDAVLFKVDQIGGACHLGYRSDFFRTCADGHWRIDRQRVFDPERIYAGTGEATT